MRWGIIFFMQAMGEKNIQDACVDRMYDGLFRKCEMCVGMGRSVAPRENRLGYSPAPLLA
jgi:hypothetical protein